MDNTVLAKAIAASKSIRAPGHLTIRPQLACITAPLAFDGTRIYHINRSYNFGAHHNSKLFFQVQALVLALMQQQLNFLWFCNVRFYMYDAANL